MNKNIFKKEEVKSFLESKVLDNIASVEELELYETYIWDGKLIKNYTYKKLVAQMKRLYMKKY